MMYSVILSVNNPWYEFYIDAHSSLVHKYETVNALGVSLLFIFTDTDAVGTVLLWSLLQYCELSVTHIPEQ